MLNIVADENMPLLDALFADKANILKMPGRAIEAKHLKNVDALLVRSITTVNQDLLANSSVKFVGTATIGVDHLQVEWLDRQKIAWANAAGCNAAAVAQYVISGICYWARKNSKQLSALTVGIIGAGNVGTELSRCLALLGINYQLCDPLLQLTGDLRRFSTLAEIQCCDVLTFHVPITRNGNYPTAHMVDADFLCGLKQNQLVINAARGEVVDNQALTSYLSNSKHADFILDVFENEPSINFNLIHQCLLATPHIAGHTLEGKLRGSIMIYRAFCQHFKFAQDIHEVDYFPQKNQFPISRPPVDIISELLQIYDIQQDHASLLASNSTSLAQHFDQLRRDYLNKSAQLPRRDYSGWTSSANLNYSTSCLMLAK